MILIFLGAPGSGKGTQAEVLEGELGLPHVASGELFREAVAAGTELGKEAKRYLDRGELVPDDLTLAMVLERLERPDCEDGVILDGFPRTEVQAKALDKALETRGRSVDAVLNLEVSRDEVVSRLSGRRICRECGANFHVRFNPPDEEGICDECGGELYQREDDEPQTVQHRLDVYHERTAPLVDYYEEQTVLHKIDGEGSIEEIRQRVLDVIGRLGAE